MSEDVSRPTAVGASRGISVCVPSVRVGTIGTAIKSIRRQTWSEWELIVVMQGDGDELKEYVADAIREDPRIKGVWIPGRGVSRARNAGIRAAQHETIAFMDDDCEASSHWLDAVREAFDADPSVGVVAGVLEAPPRTGRWPEMCPAVAQSDAILRPAADGPNLPPGTGFVSANLAIRHWVWDRVAAFDEHLGPGSLFRGGDDLDLLIRIVDAGIPIRFSSSAVVRHTYGARYGIRPVVRLSMDYGAGQGAVAAKRTLRGDDARPWRMAVRDQCLTAPLRAMRFHKIPASLPRLAAFERSYRRCVRSFTVDPAGLLRLGAGRDATPTDPTGQAGVPTIPLRSTDAGADSAAVQHVASVRSDGDPPPKTARVSIGLPVYNGEQFVADAVESVLAQKFDDFELVISDNGSTDGTPAICEAYARRDARVTYLAQEANRGASWNFNHVFERTSGELFVWLAHDDVWTPDFLQACVDELDADASAVLAFSGVSNIDERGSLLRTRTFDMRTSSPLVHERLWDVLMVWHDCLPVFGVIRRDALRSTSLIRPYASGDHLLLAELSVLGKFRFTNELLFLSRLHAGQSIQAFNIWVDHYAYSEWFEQSGTRSTSFPQWRLLRDLVTIVRRASVGRVDRVRCYGAVGRWMVRYRSLLLKDLVFAARERRGDPRKRQSPAIASISVATSEDKSGSATDQS